MRELQMASVAAETVGDAVARFAVALGNTALGLRGGSYTYIATVSGYDILLDRARWTTDIEVSGRISWDLESGAVVAALLVNHRMKQVGELTVAWDDSEPNAMATIRGRMGGHRIAAYRAAP
ncbi:MAG: hypothetical protein M3O06_06405 [Pseudomonadota bacterium]|nr:hypothetical protein [Pseudomonadota bacterium]